MPIAVPTHRSDAQKAVQRDSLLTIGVDFHGVICEHPEGSKGLTDAAWPEVPGAIAWLKAISEQYNVHLVSARFSRPGMEGVTAVQAAKAWLVARGMPALWLVAQGGQPRIWVTGFKPPCVLWIDDRGYCFRGQFPTAREIESFRPWNR